MPPLSDEEISDYLAFERLWNATKEIMEDRGEKALTFRELQALTGIHENQWGMMINGKRRFTIPAMGFVAVLWRIRPQDVFCRWPWPTMVRSAPEKAPPQLEASLSEMLLAASRAVLRR